MGERGRGARWADWQTGRLANGQMDRWADVRMWREERAGSKAVGGEGDDRRETSRAETWSFQG